MQFKQLKRWLPVAVLMLSSGITAGAFNQYNFNYGTNLTTTSTTLSFNYSLNVSQQVNDPAHPSSGGRMYGRVFLDGGAAGDYFVGEFHHLYTWTSTTSTLYLPGYPTISGNPLAQQTYAGTNTVSSNPGVTMTVPSGCIPNGTYNIRIDMYAFTSPTAEFPNGASTVFQIGSTFSTPALLNFGWYVLPGYAGSGNIGTFTVTGGGSYGGSVTVTAGTCTGNGSVSVNATSGTGPYTLYYQKLNGTAFSTSSATVPISVTNLLPGATYDFAIVDANGCRWNDRIVMPVPVPTLTVTPASQTVCKSACVTFSVSPSPGSGYTYSWTHANAAGGPTQISTVNYFCTLVPGLPNQSTTTNTYVVTATNGYCTGSATRIMTTNNSCIPATGNCCTPNPRQAEMPGEEVSAVVSLEVFPNPTSGVLTLRFNGLDRKDVKAEIYDAAGKLVRSENIGDGVSLLELQVTELPAGMYSVRLVSGDEQLMSKTFVRE